jgi:hypothetical protein
MSSHMQCDQSARHESANHRRQDLLPDGVSHDNHNKPQTLVQKDTTCDLSPLKHC